MNLYTYCQGNPLKYVDPSGNIPVPLILAVLAYLGENAIETVPDVAIDAALDGNDFSLGKSVAVNYMTNLVPIGGEAYTAAKVGKKVVGKVDNVAKSIGKYVPSPKHNPISGWGTPDPIPDVKIGQKLLESAYTSSKNKQLYNYFEGTLVKFQPDTNNTWHAYKVMNPAKEVPIDVLRKMLDDGIITKPEYKALLKNE